MTKDIVTGLRTCHLTGDHRTHYDGCIDSHPVCALAWALDEIERLRRVNDRFCDDVKTWRKLALSEHWLRCPEHLACDCLDKWVHGE